MRILLSSVLKRKITPNITASRPHIIYELAKGLANKGHNVSVLGTGDSEIPGVKIISVIPRSVIDMPSFENQFYAETSFLVQMAKKIEQIAEEFDIIHNNTYPEFINLLIEEKIKPPMVTTIHAQATKELDDVLSCFNNHSFVALSRAHKSLFNKTKINNIVYNGVDTALYSFSENKQDYLLWLGRLSKAKNNDGTFMDPKGIKWAIKLAKETGERLLMSGNVEDLDFFNQEVKPFLSEKIQWIGPVSSEHSLTKEDIVKLMQGAKAFLMTINWEEPFGLVMIESMSCGTPVIGFNRGSVSEIIINSKTGFIVQKEDKTDGLKKALSKLSQIKYRDCREHVVNNFSLEKMINNYEKIYIDLIAEKNKR